MIDKTVLRKTSLHEADDEARDYAYWMSKTMGERIMAVELMRQAVIENLPYAQQRLQRVARVTTLKQG
jgi:hypothetical protein